MKFICTGCGLCCRIVRKIKDFPEPIREDGSCVHLTQDNKCAIYGSRPDVCRLDKMAETQGKEMGMDRLNYYKYNNTLCNMIMDEAGVDSKLRINLQDYDKMV